MAVELVELVQALKDQTALQQERRLNALLGQDVEMRSMICDIGTDSINLDFIVGDTTEDKGEWEIQVFFDRSRFAEELLAYSYGDDVLVRGKLRSFEVEFIPTLTFDLQAIQKTGTTFDSRDDARRKAEASKCFVATACIGDPMALEVVTLRRFRDTVLIRWTLGRVFVRVYEYCSPSIAAVIVRSPVLRRLVRLWCVTPLARILR
jgi:hypothetical protein